jgi:hypothetical protein
MRVLALVAVAILVGCASPTYELHFSGEVRRGEHGAIFLPDWTDPPPADAGATSIPEARVSVAFEVDGHAERRMAFTTDGRFALEEKRDGELGQVLVRVEAPGCVPVERTFAPVKTCACGNYWIGGPVVAVLEAAATR